MRSRDSAAAITPAASGVADDGFIGCRRILAMMHARSPAAGMNRRSRGLQREREECPDDRQQQQNSRCPTLHESPVKQNPKLARA